MLGQSVTTEKVRTSPQNKQFWDQLKQSKPKRKSEDYKMEKELTDSLKQVGFDKAQIEKLEKEGVESADDMGMLSDDEVQKITGCNVITAKKAVAAFAPAPAENGISPSYDAIQSVLPQLPDESSFLEMLKTGGVLKIDTTNVIAAMRAAIASNIGLYDLPAILIAKMEEFAETQEEPLGEQFFVLQRQLTQRRYGDVLSALGVAGNFVSERRKKLTLEKLNSLLWPALASFNNQLKNFVEVWTKGAANPAILLAPLMQQQGSQIVLPPGMGQPPDTAVLHDEAEAVINTINKVFAGPGIPVSRALAYEAIQIREVLEDANLPSTVGAVTKDQMLKMLGVNVGADFVRLEQNITRFALAIMKLSKVESGNTELVYINAMFTLGASIPWDKLRGNSPSSLGRDPAWVHGDNP
jgi:hypothetical protein